MDEHGLVSITEYQSHTRLIFIDGYFYHAEGNGHLVQDGERRIYIRSVITMLFL